LAQAKAEMFSSAALRRAGFPVREDGQARSVFDLLGRAEGERDALLRFVPWLTGLPARVLAQLETEALYAGYLPRQEADIRAFRREEELLLDPALDYDAIGGLSTEMREKLLAHRPASLGAAARIPGVTPAALGAVVAHIRQRGRAVVDAAAP
jgi:tRNA uridine 5-carboxymethylaminomethyl modification enzyme